MGQSWCQTLIQAHSRLSEPPYAKDSHHVYVDAAFLADADPLSFTVDVDINGQYWGYAHDEDHMWRYGELQEISY